MTTDERLVLLASCAPLFEAWTGAFDAAALRGWIETELGDAQCLEHPVRRGTDLVRAVPPASLLHVVSANTPHAAFQSLLRGLLLGCRSIVKIPSTGLPELEEAVPRLPDPLQGTIELVRELPEGWETRFEAATVYGSDLTVAWFAARFAPSTRFIPHGQRLSIGLVRGDHEKAAPLAARDASRFDQRGCLSLHDVYVSPETGIEPRVFAELLAAEMEAFQRDVPRSALTPSEAGAITTLRETVRFVAASEPERVALWHSEPGTAWTVVCEADPAIAVSCLNRVVFVKPWPDDLAKLGPETRHLAALALHPFDPGTTGEFSGLGATRLCALGTVHDPPLTWHHDGIAPLASLVRWVNIG